MLNFYDSIKQIFFQDGHDYVVFMYAVGKTLITKVFDLGAGNLFGINLCSYLLLVSVVVQLDFVKN